MKTENQALLILNIVKEISEGTLTINEALEILQNVGYVDIVILLQLVREIQTERKALQLHILRDEYIEAHKSYTKINHRWLDVYQKVLLLAIEPELLDKYSAGTSPRLIYEKEIAAKNQTILGSHIDIGNNWIYVKATLIHTDRIAEVIKEGEMGVKLTPESYKEYKELEQLDKEYKHRADKIHEDWEWFILSTIMNLF